VSDWGGLACAPGDGDPDADVAGTVVLIDRGTCTFTTKIRHAQAADAVGVLIVNNVAGPAAGPAHDGSTPMPTIPALGISGSHGDDIRELLADDQGAVTITGGLEEVAAEVDLLAGFSSRGPTPFTRSLKPEIVAPGVNIVSSVFDSGWAAFQGTSMAAPHVAGAAALLLDADPTLEPHEVRSALVNRAHDLHYGVLEQGAGRLDVPAAYDATVFADPAAISFEPRQGNTNRAAPAVTVRLTGDEVDSCQASVEADSVASVSDVSGGRFTVSLPSPRELEPIGHEGTVTVTCVGEQALRIPWYAQVDRNR
jgi:minor extracellular serine protease Vpr